MSKQSKIIGFFKRPVEDSISEGEQEIELISDKVDKSSIGNVRRSTVLIFGLG